ncbi:MAG: hypothetical protein OES13_04965 [Acidimicrobiia bacterium]|nr:hypothetical protein [Acidimicrobiia bacterium]
MNLMRIASVTIISSCLLALPTATGFVATAHAQEPVFELPEADHPRAVVEIDTAARAADLEDASWTFRYLIPTALVLSVVITLVVVGRYGFGVRGRYRVKE